MKNGTNLSGATSNVLTLPAVQTTDSGSAFSVVVTNSSGSATSQVATLTVPVPPFGFLPGRSNMGYTNRQFYLTLTGPPGSSVVIYASTNLISWTPLVTNPLGSGSLSFTDTLATNFPRRFYRVTLQP